ncbi:hypothetical protein JCM14076_20550 [Methylosoma difficile]
MNSRPRIRLLPLLVLAASLSLPVAPTQPVLADVRVDVNLGVFVDALSPYGNWVNHPSYGQVWYPSNVGANWRPYTDGHWAHTDDYGWLWVSDYNWGWAPFHYGRWAWDDYYGWVWVPGTTWAPAWVFWRSGGGYAAWAPMPPNVVWQPRIGLNFSYFNFDRDLHDDAWIAVREHDFDRPHIHHHIVAQTYNRNIINVTQHINNVTVINNNIVNPGIPVRDIEHVTGRPVRPIKAVITEQSPDHHGGGHQEHHHEQSGGAGDTVEIVRPHNLGGLAAHDTQRNEEIARNIDRERIQAGPEAGKPHHSNVPGRMNGQQSAGNLQPVNAENNKPSEPPANGATQPLGGDQGNNHPRAGRQHGQAHNVEQPTTIDATANPAPQNVPGIAPVADNADPQTVGQNGFQNPQAGHQGRKHPRQGSGQANPTVGGTITPIENQQGQNVPQPLEAQPARQQEIRQQQLEAQRVRQQEQELRRQQAIEQRQVEAQQARQPDIQQRQMEAQQARQQEQELRRQQAIEQRQSEAQQPSQQARQQEIQQRQMEAQQARQQERKLRQQQAIEQRQAEAQQLRQPEIQQQQMDAQQARQQEMQQRQMEAQQARQQEQELRRQQTIEQRQAETQQARQQEMQQRQQEAQQARQQEQELRRQQAIEQRQAEAQQARQQEIQQRQMETQQARQQEIQQRQMEAQQARQQEIQQRQMEAQQARQQEMQQRQMEAQQARQQEIQQRQAEAQQARQQEIQQRQMEAQQARQQEMQNQPAAPHHGGHPRNADNP